MKLFNKWATTGEVQVQEKALTKYINVPALGVPRTGGKAAQGQRIWIQKTHIVERLMNKLMISGHKGKKHKITSGPSSGKSITVYKIVKEALEIIEKKSGKNPIQVLVTAVENAAPREEVTSIEYGGARYAKAVDMSPQRRVDFALRLMAQGAFQKSFNKKKTMAVSLSEEILAAYNIDQASAAIAKKLELERQADASR